MRKRDAWLFGGVLVVTLMTLGISNWTAPTRAETTGEPLLIAITSPTPTFTPKPSPTPTKTPTPTPKPPAGCTPGFWKNNTSAWVGFAPGQTLEDVFDVPDALGIDAVTLLAALDFGGGSGFAGAARNLLRAAVAALLNSSHPAVSGGFPYTTGQVISLTNAALASGNRSTALNQASAFGAANEAGCPVN